MAAAVCINANCCGFTPGSTDSYPPINFFYSHFHDSIRNELDLLSQSVLGLATSAQEDLHERLATLKSRYRFLEQVYKYHSSVEDEVVYPALDAKVKNVTLAYSVEHEDEERLFDQLTALLTTALRQDGKERSATLTQLECKIEEVHTTLRKHLSKEEEQLFPLLLQHFSFAEQADLVAQFLCCIPLATIEVVLAWLKPIVPEAEQQELLQQVKHVVPDRLLVQLLTAWLSPDQATAQVPKSRGTQACTPFNPNKCCKAQLGIAVLCAEDCAKQVHKKIKPAANERPPLQEITYIHKAIRSALESFADEAHSIQTGADVTASRLKALVDKHRFLRSVFTFHSASEDEVLLPAARKLMTAANAQHAQDCEQEHESEGLLMEELGRLLGEVKASSRRGAKEADDLILELVRIADAVQGDTNKHMAHEEQEVLPLLEAHLCVAEQRAMVWRTLRAMPLRLLERVMPWVAGKLSDEETAEMLMNMQLAAPEDSILVQLLSRWAQRGRRGSAEQAGQCIEDFINSTCAPSSPKKVVSHSDLSAAQTASSGGGHSQGHIRPASDTDDLVQPQAKRRRTKSSLAPTSSPVPAATGTNSSGGAVCLDAKGLAEQSARVNPIDHIFQFHKALRRDLRYMEQDANTFAATMEEIASGDTVNELPQQAIQQLKGRFTFLWGMYKAHSEAEDEIVFPALEAKEALHNVSHAYALDHQQEEELFKDIHKVFDKIQPGSSLQELRQHASQLQRMCAAMRATLEQHVKAEEHELWPLFAEHFTVEEQQHLVGMIIGRSGAEVLQAMLPWVTDSFTAGEHRAMMDSLRSATQNTMFEQWLGATMQPTMQPKQSVASQQKAGGNQPLDDVAQYFAESGIARDDEQTGSVFKPGWEDIFRMNQKQLEIAVRRMWSDSSLEPQRKAYLMQNIMASKYIVAQQRRHVPGQGLRERVGPQGAVVYRSYNQPGVLGCQHYKRGCQLKGSCCDSLHVCRHCHDEAEDHRLEASNVTAMVCMHCGVEQSPSANCHACGTRMARYFCNICQLFDDEPGRDIYHCPFCNICRIGKGLGKDARHCMQCNCCMSLAEFKTHKCRDLSTCPVCTEYLFDSNSPYRELPCGHFMHSHCFGQYTRYNYTCPVCSKSMGDMSVYFRMIDSLVARSDDLPPGYACRKQVILCNDCEQRGEAPFHFVYHKCKHCKSYNTRLV